jgi:hypothetical protein
MMALTKEVREYVGSALIASFSRKNRNQIVKKKQDAETSGLLQVAYSQEIVTIDPGSAEEAKNVLAIGGGQLEWGGFPYVAVSRGELVETHGSKLCVPTEVEQKGNHKSLFNFVE